MEKIRVMTVFGTRPEAIKLAPVIKELQKNENIQTQVVVTAQHRNMLDQVLDLFDITPDRDLDLMKTDQDLASLTASIFTNLDPVLIEMQPDWLLVQGDTTTVMASALTAYYNHIKIGHVEAGLRTRDKWHPFPEEINRRIAGVSADLHFAPSTWAKENLLREGVSEDIVKVTGNTIIDALNQIKDLPIPDEIRKLLLEKGILSQEKKLIVVTAHRRENFGKPIRNICDALKALAKRYEDQIEIIYPVHLNPNIQETVYESLRGVKNITLLAPLDYVSVVHLLKHAYMVLTDSGGIQEEATGLGIPCLVLRTVTERPEGVSAGVLKLVGIEEETIVQEVKNLLESEEQYRKMAHTANPYGDGHAAEKIVSLLLE